ncbi:MAG: NAD(P)/FAD-dependent oxidoreductase [Ruminococcaceae bacterium]|nr:NAD(P)/FAD-dependent oxidoreductase [Oscillospiraceae bacterium]
MLYDVLIIGAGVIGSMLARELSRYQLSVCVLEKENDVAMGATHANSGIIHGGYDPVPGTLKAKMNTDGVEPLFQAARDLHVPHRRNGSMVCAFGSDAEHALLDELYEQGQVNGTPDLRILSGDEARAIEPKLSPEVSRVLHVPNAGIIGPYDLAIAAMGNAMDNGAVLLRNFPVVEIRREDARFVVTSEKGDCAEGRYLVNCAGAYSDRIAAMAGDGFYTITPRAGEYMLLDRAEGDTVSHTLFQCPTEDGKGILVSPTAHGNLLVGPTAKKVASPEHHDTTPEGLAEVTRLAAKSVPSVNFRQVITSFTGIRATGSTGDFILEASKTVPGLIHAGGVESPGLTCSVSIARYLTGILREEGLELNEKSDWNGVREDTHAFQHMTDEEKDAFIREHPAYGKIVCRCEGITEGEILDAIHRNPPALDMDGVKRRTRAGMGRCQGGFCGPYVMALISRELGIPMEEVTKKGGDSRMLVERIGEDK